MSEYGEVLRKYAEHVDRVDGLRSRLLGREVTLRYKKSSTTYEARRRKRYDGIIGVISSLDGNGKLFQVTIPGRMIKPFWLYPCDIKESHLLKG